MARVADMPVSPKAEKPSATVAPGLISMEALASHHALLETIVTALEDKVVGLQRQIEHETTLLVTERQRREQETGEWKVERERARQQLNAELETERLALKTALAEVEQAQKDSADLQRDLDRMAVAQQQFEQVKQKLTTLSIAVEQDRVRAAEQLEEAQTTMHLASTSVQEAIAKEQQAARDRALAEAAQQQSAQQLEALTLKQEAHAATVTRLAALQQEIDPKLADMRQREETAHAEADKAQRLHEDAMRRIAESQQLEADLQGLMARLDAREKKLLELHIQLRTFSLELSTKAAQLKAQGAELSTPPKVPPVEDTATLSEPTPEG